MLTAKHTLDMGHATGPMPAGRRAETMPSPAADTASARAETTEAVAQSLAQIAALRDSGAITEADYEAKKQEFLDRS
jgi:hypothetical protein